MAPLKTSDPMKINRPCFPFLLSTVQTVACLALGFCGSLHAEIIPLERLPPPGTWESAGVEGGIPAREIIFADVTNQPYGADKTGGADARGAIQSAINACPPGQVVFIPSGIYRLDSGLTCSKGITIRGSGAGSTIIDYRGGGLGVFSIGSLGHWPPPKNEIPITAGSIKGSTSITVSDASSISAGNILLVDEADDRSFVWANGGNRHRASTHLVENVNGNIVKFRPPLPIDYDDTPGAARYAYVTQSCGIEALKIDGTKSTGVLAGCYFEAVWNCWVKEVELSNMPSRQMTFQWSGHCEIRECFTHDKRNPGSNSEGISFTSDVCWSLIEDNVCIRGGFPQINLGDHGSTNYSGCTGNVIAYNYCKNTEVISPPNGVIMGGDIGLNHGPHGMYNLVEGNICGKLMSDGYHGSSSHATILRNVFSANNDLSPTYRMALQIDRYNRYFNIVGNVLGDVGWVPDYYSVTIQGYQEGKGTIFRLGYPNMGNSGYNGTNPPSTAIDARDLNVETSAIIHGNYDAFNKGQIWSAGIEDRAIRPSYFRTTKPAFFGSLAWPPINPANPVANDPTLIPAGYRFVRGVKPAAGPISQPQGLRKVR